MNDAGKRWYKVIGITLVGLLITAWFAACEQSQPDADTKKETPAVSNKFKPDAEEAKQDMPAASTDTALMAPASSPGRTANDEGVNHAQQGHWNVAEGHFRKALESDLKLAEAHFNLGLALNEMGKHEDATVAFKKTAELAPENTKITESVILKQHTGAD